MIFTKSYILLLIIITASFEMSASEKEVKRSELDAMADKTIAGLVDKDGNLQKDIDESLGYAVGNAKLTKAPLVVGGGGEGILVNKKTNKRTYFTGNRFDVGLQHTKQQTIEFILRSSIYGQ